MRGVSDEVRDRTQSRQEANVAAHRVYQEREDRMRDRDDGLDQVLQHGALPADVVSAMPEAASGRQASPRAHQETPPSSIRFGIQLTCRLVLVAPVALLGLLCCASVLLIPVGVPLLVASAMPVVRLVNQYLKAHEDVPLDQGVPPWLS